MSTVMINTVNGRWRIVVHVGSTGPLESGDKKWEVVEMAQVLAVWFLDDAGDLLPTQFELGSVAVISSTR